jgi:hypothetical protein
MCEDDVVKQRYPFSLPLEWERVLLRDSLTNKTTRTLLRMWNLYSAGHIGQYSYIDIYKADLKSAFKDAFGANADDLLRYLRHRGFMVKGDVSRRRARSCYFETVGRRKLY